jgi:membrane protein
VLRGVRGAFSRFVAADGLFLGAGLAFFALVCLIPLVLIAVSTLGFVLSREQAADAVVGQLTRNFPVYRREITAAILRIVETRRLSGIVGTVVLIFLSTPLFGAVRLVVHRLLGVRGRSRLVRGLVIDLGMVLLLGVLLFAATVATWIYDWLMLFILEPAYGRRGWVKTAGIALSLTISTVAFYLAYRYAPHRRIRRGPALAGAAVASGLLEIAKEIFRFYIRNVGVYDEIYGTLGVLVAFVMFVYYAAVVFVFGAAYAAARDSL